MWMESHDLYSNILYQEVADGEVIWLSDDGVSKYYLDTQLTIDRDQYNISYVRAFNDITRISPGSLVNYPAFSNGTVGPYASDNIGLNDDIREMLPKKYIDFNKAIKDLGGKLLYIKSGSTCHSTPTLKPFTYFGL